MAIADKGAEGAETKLGSVWVKDQLREAMLKIRERRQQDCTKVDAKAITPLERGK